MKRIKRLIIVLGFCALIICYICYRYYESSIEHQKITTIAHKINLQVFCDHSERLLDAGFDLDYDTVNDITYTHRQNENLTAQICLLHTSQEYSDKSPDIEFDYRFFNDPENHSLKTLYIIMVQEDVGRMKVWADGNSRDDAIATLEAFVQTLLP